VKKTFLFFAILFITPSLFAIAPAKKGVKVPSYLVEEFKQIRAEYSSGYWPQEMARRHKLQESGEGDFVLQATAPTTVLMPVLLGYYGDSQPKYTTQDFQNDLFDSNPKGTVTQFYNECSYGKMYLGGTVSNWARTPKTLSYYAGTDGKSNDGRRDFVIDLLFSIDPTFDFSPYVDVTSLDAEGYHVRLVAAIHTGAGAEAGASNIWSHRWNIRPRILTRKNNAGDTLYNNSKILASGHFLTNDTYLNKPVVVDGDYACEPEMAGSNNTNGSLIEIGVFCHEFGHLFGLPDLYNTAVSGTGDQGLGNWCLMAGGSWGGDGGTPAKPAHFSAWCKEQLGFVTPTVVTKFLPQHSIKKVEQFPEIYKLWSQGQSSNEYFLVENREKVGFDTSLVRGGLLIFHVVEIQSSVGNTDPNHHWVDLEQADGLRNINIGTNRGDAGDPYPGSTNNRTFDGYSNPNSMSYASAQSYVGVRNISSEADTMYADLDVGARPYLRPLAVTQVDAGQASVNGRLEPGENGSLIVQIQNIYPTTATNAELRIAAAAQGLTVDTNVTIFSLLPSATADVTTTAKIRVQQNFVPKEIQLNVDLKATDFHQVYTVPMTLGYPAIAILDGDSIAQTSVLFCRSALDSIGRYYEVLRTRDSVTSNSALFRRKTMIYLSGNMKYQTISAPVLDSLSRFFQNGGNLILSGQNIAEDLQGRGITALTTLFHVQWSQNLVIGRTLYGMPSDGLGSQIKKVMISGADGFANQTSPDIILSDGVSVPFLTYGSINGTSIAGAYYQNNQTKSKLVFLGFGLEAISNLTSETSRGSFIKVFFDWFDTPTGVFNSPLLAPLSYEFKQAYPNPFNPSCQLEFQIPQRAFVEVELYNLLGQKVRNVLSSELVAGQHRLTIDGTGLASGTYICRIHSNTYSASQKIVLLK
jgi:M6 family metalloprotease-like protein